MEKKVKIELSNNEVLVLSDLLFRLNNTNILNNFFVDQAEQRALWNLESILEKVNTEIFKSDYSSLLKEARNNLRDSKE